MADESTMQTRDEFVRLLAQVPGGSWERMMTAEPEWREMERFLPAFGFGPFATMMVATGLNDFQLKGKADRAYWPPIRRLLEAGTPPAAPKDLADALAPFYECERLAPLKGRRLRQFLNSRLAAELWQSTPTSAAEGFGQTWQRLAAVMNQGMEKKTIVFAMKCLGLALIMAGEYDFASELLPIPVDLRVRRLTEALGQPTESDDVVREYWADILTDVRKTNPHVTMIHLDSFVWQVADSVSEPAVCTYCRSMGMGEVGDEMAALIGRGAHAR